MTLPEQTLTGPHVDGSDHQFQIFKVYLDWRCYCGKVIEEGITSERSSTDVRSDNEDSGTLGTEENTEGSVEDARG